MLCPNLPAVHKVEYVMLMARKLLITTLKSQIPVQTFVGLVARAGTLCSDQPADIVRKHPRLLSIR